MIIAIDLGRSAGFAIGADDPPHLEQIDMPEDLGRMMSAFEGAVRGKIREYRPRLLCWERPFITVNRMDAQGEIRTQRLYGQAAAAAKLAREYEIESLCERPASIRKKVVGAGNASEDDIMKFCVRAKAKPFSAHTADAYVVWRFGKAYLDGHANRRAARGRG